MRRLVRGVRGTLLLAFLPMAVLLLVFAVKVLVMLGANDAGRDAYADGRYVDSASQFERNRKGDVLEDWVASYNRGTAMYRLGRYAEARADLERALARVPKQQECLVRLNLALTLEAQGDELRTQQRAAEAQQLYAQARTVLRDGRCGELADRSASGSPSQTRSGSPSNASSGTPSKSDSGKPSTATSGKPSTGSSGQPTTGSGSGKPTPDPTNEQEQKQQEGERAKETDERLGQKEQQAQKEAEQQQRNQSRAATASASKSASASSDPQSQQSQLDQKNKEGQQEQQERKDSNDRTASGGPTATAEKRW